MRKINTFLFVMFLTFTMNGLTVAANSLPSLSYEEERNKIESISDLYIAYDNLPTGNDAYEILSEDPFSPVFLEPDPTVYVVEAGDNLYRIALEHNMSLDSLISLNDLNSYLIYPGDELLVSEEGITDEQAEMVALAEPEDKTEVKVMGTSSPPAGGQGKEMTMVATAYTAYCEGCSGTTAYGIDLRANPNEKVIAVDPKVIPLGTRVWVEGYGEAIAGDTGGAIKGNKIDVFIPSYDNAIQWGRKEVKLIILD